MCVCCVHRSYLLYFFFFFSSRRRHTRCLSGWSSDVCSSDLSHGRRTVAPLIGDQRGKGASPMTPARGTGMVSGGTARGLTLIIWQPHHKDFSASHWHPSISVADDAQRLDWAKSLLGVQIRIPCSDRVRSLWSMGAHLRLTQECRAFYRSEEGR